MTKNSHPMNEKGLDLSTAAGRRLAGKQAEGMSSQHELHRMKRDRDGYLIRDDAPTTPTREINIKEFGERSTPAAGMTPAELKTKSEAK